MYGTLGLRLLLKLFGVDHPSHEQRNTNKKDTPHTAQELVLKELLSEVNAAPQHPRYLPTYLPTKVREE